MKISKQLWEVEYKINNLKQLIQDKINLLNDAICEDDYHTVPKSIARLPAEGAWLKAKQETLYWVLEMIGG